MQELHPFTSTSRREFLVAGASLSGFGMAAMLVPRAHAARANEDEPETSAADRLDAAYERIHARLPSTNVHRSNHVAMVSEALYVLGHSEAIAAWLDGNLDDSPPEPVAIHPIDAEHWRSFLAGHQHYSSWRAFFIAELGADDWRPVLRRWVPRFAPGLAGVATHGVIRTGHAVRTLAARDNEIRRRELATALAYWAVNYEELPWDRTLAPETSVEAAFAKLQPRRPALEPSFSNIVGGLRALNETPSFRPVAGLVDTRDPARTLSEIASACARRYLQNPDQRIAFTHSITAPSALRLLAPYLDDETVQITTRYAWQAAAGLYVVYGDPRRAMPAEKSPAKSEQIVARAVENGAPHGIKLTEACLREEALSHDSVLIQTAQDAAEKLNG